MDLPERAYRLSNMLPAWNKSGLYAEFKSKVKLYLECLGYYLDGRDGTGFLAVEPSVGTIFKDFLKKGQSEHADSAVVLPSVYARVGVHATRSWQYHRYPPASRCVDHFPSSSLRKRFSSL
jgi:hypothetical protein